MGNDKRARVRLRGVGGWLFTPLTYMVFLVTHNYTYHKRSHPLNTHALTPKHTRTHTHTHTQMGRGRTTTGTIIGTLLHLRKLGAFPPGAKNNMPLSPAGSGADRAAAAAAPAVPVWFPLALQATPPVGEQTKDKLKWGMYDVVRSLLR